MVSQSTPADDAPPIISQPGEWDLQKLISGCRVWVTRPAELGGSVEERKAEVLATRERNKSIYAPTSTSNDPADDLELYVHYVDFNKRLDEWIPGSRVILQKDLEWPKPKTVKKETYVAKKTVPKRQTKKASTARSSATPGPVNPLKRKAGSVDYEETEDGSQRATQPPPGDDEFFGEEDAEGENEAMDEDDIQIDDPTKPLPVHSKKDEIEKLRTSGSMTQNVHEVARVKNLNKIQIGKHVVEPWYFSPYPKEYSGLPILYICEFCLHYLPSPYMFSRHRKKCQMLHPPGNEIYRCDEISFFELDGKKQLTWCRNLSLLSKCFLDHKTLYYDVQPFLYYIMCQRDEYGCHVLGYFSKEKESAEGYNLACILTLPQHQRHGYGRLLIEFSYELSKREGKLGSPEKPLSDLGLIGYRAFWLEKIMEYLLENEPAEVNVDEIAHKTAITHQDITSTLISMQMLKTHRNNHILCITEAALEAFQKSQLKVKRRINSENLRNWKPPSFTRDQLRAWAY